MALTLNITLQNGLDVNGAYARVDTVNGSKEKVTISLNYYVNQQSFLNGKSYLKQEFYSFVPSVADGSVNFIKQSYEYLKTLAAFTGAIDA